MYDSLVLCPYSYQCMGTSEYYCNMEEPDGDDRGRCKADLLEPCPYGMVRNPEVGINA